MGNTIIGIQWTGRLKYLGVNFWLGSDLLYVIRSKQKDVTN